MDIFIPKSSPREPQPLPRNFRDMQLPCMYLKKPNCSFQPWDKRERSRVAGRASLEMKTCWNQKAKQTGLRTWKTRIRDKGSVMPRLSGRIRGERRKRRRLTLCDDGLIECEAVRRDRNSGFAFPQTVPWLIGSNMELVLPEEGIWIGVWGGLDIEMVKVGWEKRGGYFGCLQLSVNGIFYEWWKSLMSRSAFMQVAGRVRSGCCM